MEQQHQHEPWSYEGWVERYGQEEADIIKARYIHEILYGKQLTSDEYADYIASPRWKALAEKTKERVGYRCQVCNSKDRIDVHHPGVYEHTCPACGHTIRFTVPNIGL